MSMPDSNPGLSSVQRQRLTRIADVMAASPSPDEEAFREAIRLLQVCGSRSACADDIRALADHATHLANSLRHGSTAQPELLALLDDIHTLLTARPEQLERKVLSSLFQSSQSGASTSREFIISTEVERDFLLSFKSEAGEHCVRAEAAVRMLREDPDDDASLNAIFRAFHSVKGVTGFLGLAHITEFAHRAESFFDRYRLRIAEFDPVSLWLASESITLLRNLVQNVDAHVAAGRYLATDAFLQLIAALGVPGDSLQASRINAALLKADSLESTVPGEKTIRVNSADVRRLAELAREFTVLLSDCADRGHHGDSLPSALIDVHSLLEPLARQLNMVSKSLASDSLNPLFDKYSRMAAELARSNGKLVSCVTEGGDLILPRKQIELLDDALLHIVRNAIAHGIETPDQRMAMTKPREGRIGISAHTSDGGIEIRVSDDGYGLDREAILLRAIESGILSDHEGLTEEQIYQCIWMPGFTSAAETNQLCGRGVGLDVVKSAMESAGGTAQVFSNPFEGTTFTLWIPRAD